MYERLNGLFNPEELNILNMANILLVGVGGVGSFCFEVLIRSGIKNITIADFDTYENTNLNRQLHSNWKVMGMKKVDVLKEVAYVISKDLNVSVIDEKISKESNIDFSKFDYIIDACDDIEAKVFLINKAFENNVKIISSLGVGNRVDPSKIVKTKLSKTFNDPLAKKLRSTLKKEGFTKDLNVIFSTELPIKSKVVSSYIGVSGVAGMMLADYVVKDLVNDKDRAN